VEKVLPGHGSLRRNREWQGGRFLTNLFAEPTNYGQLLREMGVIVPAFRRMAGSLGDFHIVSHSWPEWIVSRVGLSG